MLITIGQTNPIPGRIVENTNKIMDQLRYVNKQKRPLFLLSLSSIYATDIAKLALIPSEVVDECRRVIQSLIQFKNKDLVIVTGSLMPCSKPPFIKPVLVVIDGKEKQTFDLKPSQNSFSFQVQDKKFHLAILDGKQGEIEELLYEDCDHFVIMDKFPYGWGADTQREESIEELSKRWKRPILYYNYLGCIENICFSGKVRLTSEKGECVFANSMFQEQAVDLDLSLKDPVQITRKKEIPEKKEALLFNIRGFAAQAGLKNIVLGISGGIDSAVVASLMCEAMDNNNIMGLSMPSIYSTEGSLVDADTLVTKLDMRMEIIPIAKLLKSFNQSLEALFSHAPPGGLMEENLQARIRGTLLMAYANKTNSIVVNTGNKSEIAMGYCTLYGDTIGACSIIGDFFKTEVYELAALINETKEIIPQNTLTKPPSAELKHGQKDEDNLPPYPLLDAILKKILYENLSVGQIVKAGFDKALVTHIASKLASAEFKRRQGPPILKVCEKTFGTELFMPL